MTEEYHIVDDALPIAQDFKQIKLESIAYLQEFSGNSWTNFNPSDPGITILDQVCFALTELGYCIDFPIKDILTKRDGNLTIKDQFYRPEEILTTTPILINDFRKFLVDGIDVVKNVLVVPQRYGVSSIGGVYDTYLYVVSRESSDSGVEDQIILAARYQFARCRNFGESFSLPKMLERERFLLTGSIEIDSKQELEKIVRIAQRNIDNYIFPNVKQYGYNEMKDAGVTTNDIFDGPKMENGWIKTSDLGSKKDQLKITQLITILDSSEGILSVNKLAFGGGNEKRRSVESHLSELIFIDLISSLAQGLLEIVWKGKAVNSTRIDSAVAKLRVGTSSHDPEKTVVKTEPYLPKGKFREINDYYSIQNTFPEIFGVGDNSIENGASDYKVGRSRQLKGYLTLFDQVLGNEFEQLSNLGQLFSFQNAISPAPMDLRNYFDHLDQFEKNNQEYPAPYLRFSPTYFCRSLYDIPNISPLLKNSKAFNYSMEMKSIGQQEIDSWKDYQNDPYNSYIHGMMEIMEDDNDGWSRRNDILNHILSRHGESPHLIDEIITESEYALNKMQNQVIFKSLYLQNLGLLSYYRCKAYNFLRARRVNETIPMVSNEIWIELNEELSRDFVFQSRFIDKVERLYENDFDNYSALELKLNLLLGLRVQYRNFIVNNFKNESLNKEVDQAHWMMHDRKGVILIESNLLMESADFELFIRFKSDHNKSWQVGLELNHAEVQRIRSWVVSNWTVVLEQLKFEGMKRIDDFKLTSKKLEKKDDWFSLVGETGLEIAVKTKWGEKIEMSTDDKILKNTLQVFAPDYVPYFKDSIFTNTFEYFMADTVAPRIGHQFKLLNRDQLEDFIPKFAAWHNSLIFNSSKNLKSPTIVAAATELIEQLISISNYVK